MATTEIAKTLADYLETCGFGTVNTDIFIGYIPEDTNGLWVDRIGGIQNNYVPMEEAACNIYAKNTNAQVAVDQLESIKNFIHRMHTTEAGENFIYTMLVIGNIEDVSRDIEYAKIFKLTVQLVYRNTNLIS